MHQSVHPYIHSNEQVIIVTSIQGLLYYLCSFSYFQQLLSGIYGVIIVHCSTDPETPQAQESRFITSSISSFQLFMTSSPTLNTHRSITENDPPKSNESCRSCLYTGVATCTGLSLYFLKLSTELPESGAKEVMRQVSRQRNFLIAGSVAWAIAGIYRVYLD